MEFAASVVLTTYERPRHLELVLEGYRRQSRRDFELLIADDGSGPRTAQVVDAFARSSDLPVSHLWQPDEGYRRALALNRGIAAARSDYVIFSDGDCIPPRDFVEMHCLLRRARRMLIGGYFRISPEEAAGADAAWVARGEHERCCSDAQRRALLRRHRKNCWQIWTRRRRRPHNLGLNMSVEREALLRVNGYDENYRGWANSDGDLRERLKRCGIRPLSIWDRNPVAHLDHPIHSTRFETKQANAYSKRSDIPIFAEQGIVKPDEDDDAPPSADAGAARPGRVGA